MANRYNPPQKRPANITANYFTPLTITSDANTDINASTSVSARHIPTSLFFSQAPAPALAPASAPAPGTYIHALRTHPSSPPPTTTQPQMQASASPSSMLTTHFFSHLRGDSTPYIPIQSPNLTSPSSTTPNQQNPTLPHQTSRQRTTGLTHMPELQHIWPTPSPHFQKQLPSQSTSSSTNVQSSTQKQPKPSVKHLTCYFWSEFGHCQWSSAECLYAHWYTGKVASAPVQVEVGKPAVAGRNAESAKPRYEDWRPSTEKASIAGDPPMPSSSSSHYHASAPLPFPPPPPPSDATHKGTGGDPSTPTALLIDAVKTLSAALHAQQTRVVGMKAALVEQCQAMLDLAHAVDARGLPIDEFVERSMLFVESVAEHGREAEELGALLGRVRAKLEGAGLSGVVRGE